MSRRLLVLSLSIAVLFVFSAPITPVDAGGKDKIINWRVAGSMVNPVVTQADPEKTYVLINLSAVGAPGPAQITILAYGEFAGSDTDICGPAAEFYKIIFLQDEMVAVFPDLSLLFANLLVGGEAYLCKAYDDTVSFFKFDMEIVGGTGRFEGATGQFEAAGDGYGKYFPGTPLSSETGEFIGEINY